MNLFKSIFLSFFLVSLSYSQINLLNPLEENLQVLIPSSGVNISLSNLKENGVLVTNNSVNFNNQATLQFSVDVLLETFNGDFNNIFGNVILYYKESNSSQEIQLQTSPVTFTVSYPPFVSQTTYNSVVYFNAIALNSSNFFSTGGKIYAKYINNNGNIYVSSGINVIGGIKTQGSNNPQISTICCNQTIRWGDKPQPIVGSDANSFYSSWGISVSPSGTWTDTNGGSLTDLTAYTGLSLHNLEFDYIFENKTVKRTFTPIWSSVPNNMAPNKLISNVIEITVVPNPILTNIIWANFSQLQTGEYEVNSSEVIDILGFNSRVNINVIDNPFHVPNRSDPTVNVLEYQWQYSPYKLSNNRDIWLDLSGEIFSSLQSFLPVNYLNNKFKIRRIAKYGNISLVSNVLSFKVRDSNISSNFICCDQSLTNGMSGVSVPNTLIGNDTQFSFSDGNIDQNSFILNSHSVSYQWQYRANSSNSTWQNLICQTKDCLPNILPTMPNTFRFYRRIAIVNYSISSIANPLSISSGSYTLYSNEVTISVLGRGSRVAELNVNNDKNVVLNEFNISIYPNPANEKVFLNIKSSTSKESQFKLRIFNNLGLIVYEDIINKKEQIDFPINVSNLSSGLYYFEVEDENGIIISKKLLIE